MPVKNSASNLAVECTNAYFFYLRHAGQWISEMLEEEGKFSVFEIFCLCDHELGVVE